MTDTPNSHDETYDLAARFLQVFVAFGRLAKQETPDTVEHLNVNQLRALALIYQEPGITQKDIAEALDITAASVSVNITRMVEAGLVDKVADPEDGRVMQLFLANKGKAIVKRMEHQQVQMIADLLSNLSADEQRLIVDALERALTASEHNFDIKLITE